MRDHVFSLSNQPRPILGILTDSFQLYKRLFFRLLPLATLIAVIFVFSQKIFNKTTITNTIDWSMFTLALISQFITFWFFLFLLYRVSQKIILPDKGYKHTILTVTKKFPRSVIVGIILSFMLFIGSLLLVLPAIVMSVLFLFVFLGILIDDDGIITAFKHSARLVSNHWGRTFVLLLAMIFVSMVTILAVEAAIHTIVFTTPSILKLSQNAMSQTFLSMNNLYITLGLTIIITIPWIAIMMVLQYHDLTLRYQSRLK